MAFVGKKQQDEEEGGTPALAQAPLMMGMGSQQAPGAGTPPAAKGTGFPDLQRYLDLNAPAAEELAGKVADPIESRARTAGGQITQEQQSYIDDLRKSNPMASADVIKKAAATPEKLTAEEKAQFIGSRKGTFTGSPWEQGDAFGRLSGDVRDISERGKSLMTESGQNLLLNELSSDPTRGKNLLNRILMNQSAPASARLKTASEAAAPLSEQLEGARTATMGEYDTRKSGLEQAARDIQAQFMDPGGVLSKFGESVSGMTKAQRDAAMADLTSRYGSAYKAPKIYVPESWAPGGKNAYPGSEALYTMPKEMYDTPEEYDYWFGTAGGGKPQSRWSPEVAAMKAQREIDYGGSMFGGRGRPADTTAMWATPEMFAREAALQELLGQNFDILNDANAGMAGRGAANYEKFKSQPFTARPDPTYAFTDEPTAFTASGWRGDPDAYARWQREWAPNWKKRR